MKNRTTNIYQLTITAMMAAILCILGPIVIPLPFSPVPLSLSTFAIYLAVYALGAKWGTISYAIYYLLGLAGLPVFSGFSGGVGKAAGPTGGYMIGFFFMAILSGFIIDRYRNRRVLCIAGMLGGMIVTDLFGTVWLSYQMNLSFWEGFSIGTLPYLIGDVLKIAAAALVGPVLYKALNRMQRSRLTSL